MNDLITDLEIKELIKLLNERNFYKNTRRSSIRILKIKKIWKIMNVGCV